MPQLRAPSPWLCLASYRAWHIFYSSIFHVGTTVKQNQSVFSSQYCPSTCTLFQVEIWQTAGHRIPGKKKGTVTCSPKWYMHFGYKTKEYCKILTPYTFKTAVFRKDKFLQHYHLITNLLTVHRLGLEKNRSINYQTKPWAQGLGKLELLLPGIVRDADLQL